MESTYRATCRTQFTKLCKQIHEFLDEELEAAPRKREIGVYLHRLKNLHEKLKVADKAIVVKEDDAAREFETVLEYDDRAVALIAKLEIMLQEEQVVVNRVSKGDRENHQENERIGLKLKAIELKTFNGDFENWLPFWEQFKHAVHENSNLPPIAKFSFLSQALVGKAAESIAGFTTSEKCYDEAISLLLEEYGDNDKIIERYIQKLLSIKAISSCSDVKGLRHLYNEVKATMRTLAALEVSAGSYEITVRSVLLKALPSKMRIEFHKLDKQDLKAMSSNISLNTVLERGKEYSEQLRSLLCFIKREVEALEKSELSEKEKTKDDQTKKSSAARGSAVGLYTNYNGKERQCVFCKGTNHNEGTCKKDMTVEQRKEILRKEGRCFRCAVKNHNSKNCKSQWVKCTQCKGRHLSTMCERKDQNRAQNKNSSIPVGEENVKKSETTKVETTATLSAAQSDGHEIYLQTARAFLINNSNSRNFLTRVIMDNGSQRTYITQYAADRLNLPVVREERARIIAFGEEKSNKPASKQKTVKLCIKGQYSDKVIEIDAIVVPKICADILPAPKVTNPEYKTIKIELADRIACSGKVINGINLLIGQDNYWKINTTECKRVSDNMVAVKTFFGWTLQGGCDKNNAMACVLNTSYEREEDFSLSNFWNLESIGIQSDDQVSMPDVNINFIEGRYVVNLPWKIPREKLENNKNIAIKRLQGLMLKLAKDPNKQIQYDEGIRELVQSGVAEKVLSDTDISGVYYMPHRPVYRDDKLTTKMRIVFDASSSGPDSLSLNEHLSAGQNLVADLLSILLRFRSDKIAITADIEKAFLQIGLEEAERNSHRFIWYESLDSGSLAEYRMTRVTFGVTSSPFLLAATIKKHLQTSKDQYGGICDKLQRSFYVDDLIASVPNRQEGNVLIRKAKEIMERAHFNLRKWNTNDKELKNHSTIAMDDQPMDTKVLGVKWCTLSDCISVDLATAVNYIKPLRATKRNVAKAMARIYDPLGLLGPFTVRVKILLQDLWKMKIGWDQTIEGELLNNFQNWQDEIPLLLNVTTPRCFIIDKHSRNQLHIFADASLRAFGAVAYMRSETSEGEVAVRLICSKNRVSPMRKNEQVSELTLPKLELTAALMAARLKKYIVEAVEYSIESIYFWTDSTIALNWIQGHGRQIKPYISARVKEINKLTNIYNWRHCDGKTNPADLVTRGVKALQLVHSTFWNCGPPWLIEPQSQWPAKSFCLVTTVNKSRNEDQSDSESYAALFPITSISHIKKLLRITAYVLRFTQRAKLKLGKPNRVRSLACVDELTATELHAAELYWVKSQQRQYFAEEIKALEVNRLQTNSKIFSLNPILENGILKLRSRLSLIEGTSEQTNPAILPKRSWLCVLLINEAHKATLHGGVNTVLTTIRKKYWIIQGRQLIKSIIQRCTTCKRLHGKFGSEPWVALPQERIMTTRPFENTGVDFAGPLYAKTNDGCQSKKVYIMLFTCAAIRAVHLELIEDMTVKSCVEALRRFMARRGVPNTIMSDNARTFKRTDLELRKLNVMVQNDEFQRIAAHKGITWKYIPERAAWWGGFWERLVGTVKTAIKAGIGKSSLTTSELSTFLTEVESVINERPLTYISSDSNDLEPLTPSHFLANNCCLVVDGNFKTDHEFFSQSWLLRQILMKRYLKRWQTEYLNQLRSIHHNTSGISRSIKAGDVVLLQDDLKRRLEWKLALVKTTYAGRDGRVRACDVRLASGVVLKRPIQLLVPLECSGSAPGGEDVEN